MVFLNYLSNILWALDVVLMQVFRGHRGETLSSCAYRMRRDGKFWGFLCPIIDGVVFWENMHCWNSYLACRDRQYPD